jgi:hypothetical protein
MLPMRSRAPQKIVQSPGMCVSLVVYFLRAAGLGFVGGVFRRFDLGGVAHAARVTARFEWEYARWEC